MSAVVGERDKALRSTFPRNINPTAGKTLLLDVDPVNFHVAADGTITPAVATFTARTIGFDATVMWSITNGGTLSGSAPNVRTLAASSLTAQSVKVTVTVIYDGQAYIAFKSIGKVSDGKAGADAPPVDMSPAALLAALENRITESQLYADLRAKINLITDPVSMPGSVQAQVKAETDARVAALQAIAQNVTAETTARVNAFSAATAKSQQDLDKEISDRIAAVLAEAGARTTYVQNYTFSKQEMNSALSIQASQIAAAYTAYTDLKTGQVATDATAYVRNYSYSKADTNSAISAAETRLRAEFVSGNGATEAFVTNWSYSKAQSDSAEAAQTATLTTSFQGYADQKKSEAIAAAAADVRNYSYSKSDANAAEAAQSADLTTKYTAYADAARTAATTAAAADVRNYSYAKSAVDGAIAASESRLRAEFVGSGGATEAYVTNYAYSKAAVDGALAIQASALTTGYTSAVSGAVAALPPLVANMLPSNSLPASSSGFTAAPSDPPPAIASWEGPLYDLNSYWSPYRQGSVYTHAFGTPTPGSLIDMYWFGSDNFAKRFPVVPKQRYEFSAALSAHRCQGFVVAVFYKANGDYITEFSSGPVVDGWNYDASPGDAFPRALVFATAPDGAAVAMILSRQFHNGGQDPHVFTSQMYMGRAGATQTTGTKYTDFSPTGIAADIVKAQAAAIVASAADVRNYAISKSDATAAEAAQTSAITTSYTAYADAARVAAINAAGSDVRSYSYSKSATDSALAAVESRLRSEFVSTGGATEGFVTNYAYSKAQIDQAEALQSSTLTTAYKSYADDKAGLAVTNANAFTQQYAYAKSAVDGAISSLSTQITASYQSYAQGLQTQTLATSAADVRSYSVAKADLSGAIAQATSSLSTTVGRHTATIQNQSTSIGGLSTQQVLKSDINGYVTGIGLASSAAGATPTSEIILMADVLGFVTPGLAPKKLLTVGRVNGQSGMVLRGDFYADGDIKARNIAAGAITATKILAGNPDNIVPDPQFRDLEWWRRTGSTVSQWGDAGQVTGWKGGASMYLAKGDIETDSAPFQMTPGATYLIEIQVGVSTNFNGRLGVYFLIPQILWYPMIQGAGVQATGQTWPSGLPVSFNAYNPAKFVTCSSVYTVPTGGTFAASVIKVQSSFDTGSCEIGSISITRMTDSVILADGAVTASKLLVVRAPGSPEGVEISKYGGKSFDPSGVKRFQWGNLDV